MVELIPQRTVSLEINHVDVSEVGEFVVEEFEVIGDATHGHVALHDVVTAPVDATRNQIAFRFLKGEGHQVHPSCRPVEQSAFVGEDLFGDPRGSGSTSD